MVLVTGATHGVSMGPGKLPSPITNDWGLGWFNRCPLNPYQKKEKIYIFLLHHLQQFIRGFLLETWWPDTLRKNTFDGMQNYRTDQASLWICISTCYVLMHARRSTKRVHNVLRACASWRARSDMCCIPNRSSHSPDKLLFPSWDRFFKVCSHQLQKCKKTLFIDFCYSIFIFFQLPPQVHVHYFIILQMESFFLNFGIYFFPKKILVTFKKMSGFIKIDCIALLS